MIRPATADSRRKTLRVQNVETKTLEAKTLYVSRIQTTGRSVLVRGKLLRRIHALREELRELRSELHHLQKEIRRDQHHLEEQIHSIQRELRRLRTSLESGLPANPALETYFSSRQGQIVTVTTSGGTITGTVTEVGTNAVLLTESNGDLVLIPYVKITAVQ
ncbi:hypothetical protein [Sulfoacidibacillus thermotolerans]|uniref:DUF2642 domain-containing protein n=1 Tax=Sulfoacidibacillus thermotolerans TaxID=1765684 RepID=A0A2U3D860_SULT2|nr:hypothetical protein [Sulfoacidibacillus thermotolerans]PWI57462.1 hypothetical protein BM613_08280 [Sulfoacidibacillus thermotolerans]